MAQAGRDPNGQGMVRRYYERADQIQLLITAFLDGIIESGDWL